MGRPNYTKQIEERIEACSPDAVFITSDFLDIADAITIGNALSRLVQDGKIRRIIRGLYDRPRFSKLLNEPVAPKMEEIAAAIARNYRWTIVPCGDTALNILGLSTQVPSVWQYVSDGPYRKYQIDARRLEFKHSKNKDITGVSYKSALVFQAFKAIGDKNVTDQVILKLSQTLSETEKAALLTETQFGTTWMLKHAKAICVKEKQL